MKLRFPLLVLVVLATLAVSLASCAAQGTGEVVSTSVLTPVNQDADVPTPVWPALLQVTPQPFASPLPSTDTTAYYL